VSTWLITGCSTGLGRALAQAVLERGWNAVVTARNPETVQDIVSPYPGNAISLPLDVTSHAQIAAAVQAAEQRFGSIDVLVNNAGYGYRSAVEEGEVENVARLFETNFFGLVALIKAALPGMRAKRKGAIVNISSTAGRRSNPGSGYYSATKFAVAGMSDALRKELAPLGIKVIVVEPSGFRTDFAGRSLHESRTRIDDYAETAGRRRKEHDRSHGQQAGDPARGAQAIIKVVESDHPPERLALGRDAVNRIRDHLKAHLEELENWAELGISADFPRGQQ
jgi:NAD(P)-dependent dehydrogenase (short-subunit alcohol dehydrogenase family)